MFLDTLLHSCCLSCCCFWPLSNFLLPWSSNQTAIVLRGNLGSWNHVLLYLITFSPFLSLCFSTCHFHFSSPHSFAFFNIQQKKSEHPVHSLSTLQQPSLSHIHKYFAGAEWQLCTLKKKNCFYICKKEKKKKKCVKVGIVFFFSLLLFSMSAHFSVITLILCLHLLQTSLLRQSQFNLWPLLPPNLLVGSTCLCSTPSRLSQTACLLTDTDFSYLWEKLL